MRGITLSALAMLAMTAAPLAAGDDVVVDGDLPIEEHQAMSAVTAFMDSFDAGDEAAMKALIIDGAMVTVIEEREGEDRLQMVPLAGLVSSIANATADLEEPIRDMQVIQEGPVATVTARFDFMIDGELSHCGTNVFNLVRVDGTWKIAGIAYSHIEEGCLEEATQ